MDNSESFIFFVFGAVIGILITIIPIAATTEICNEDSIVKNICADNFTHDGHHYAYRIVIDSAKSDSLNRWQK